MKCIECGHQTDSQVEARELDLGLPYHVVVQDSPVEVCPNCGERYEGIAAPEQTLQSIGRWIAERPGRLHSSEVRFLRNAMAWSQEQLGMRLGVAPETVSRWENGRKPVGYQSELALRFLILAGSEVAERLDSTEGPPTRVDVVGGVPVKAAG